MKLIRSRRGIAVFSVFAVATASALETDGNLKQTAKKLLSILERRQDGGGGPDLTSPLEVALADTHISAGAESSKSPQLQALRWLSESTSARENLQDTSPIDADTDLAQRYALAVLYFATGGDSWKECSQDVTSKCESSDGSGLQSSAHFLSGGPVCSWFGLTCTNDQKKDIVTWIDLSKNGLSGSIPNELSLLSDNLELLWLSGNPELGGNLPQWIGKMKHLQSLSFFDSGISGTIPDSLYNLSKLSSLRAYGSKLEGTISTKIGQLKNMQWLWMHGCEFTGTTIPTELGSLKKLEALTMHGNAFGRDTLPSEVCDLRTSGTKKLEHLWTNCDANRSCDCCTKCFPRSGVPVDGSNAEIRAEEV